MFDNATSRQRTRFSRLGTLYLVALSIIATVAIVGQVLIHSHLRNQNSDSRVVNVAGKQRMLSQKIAKIVLTLQPQQSIGSRQEILRNLETSLHLWSVSQQGLQQGNDSLHLPGKNSPAITALFAEVEPSFQAMRQHALALTDTLHANPEKVYDLLKPDIAAISKQEQIFLAGMEHLVAQYEDEAHHKVEVLSTIEYVVLAISLLVIALELIFIFRPTTVYVSKTLEKLMSSERNARKLTKEIGELYSSLEKSYEQLSIVNQPVESPKLLAKADQGGTIIFLADGLLRYDRTFIPYQDRISDLFTNIAAANDWMDDLVEIISDGRQWQGELSVSINQTMHWLDITILPVYQDGSDTAEIFILGADITGRKDAERSMTQKNKAEIEKKINQQKFRSVLILEGQEEERKRLAMDIHDGIGQMLTSLNFQIESIDTRDETGTKAKVQELDQLVKDVIKEVRRVTFNLKPTVLGDYGLQAALRVFIQEIGKLTAMKLSYTSEGIIERLPQNIENNIFRIIQEAINNAIKYSGSPTLNISLEQAGAELVIQVADAGKGFDARMAEAKNMNIESGRGLFNMYERTEYVHGRLVIDSVPGKGTTVSLRVPLRTTQTVSAVATSVSNK